MDYRDDERDHYDDSPFCDPESGEPCAPPGLSSFYVGYTGRSIQDEAMRWLTLRGASQQAEDGTFVDPAARNPLTPGRKPFHTLNPAMARFKDGRSMVYGTMGGEGQPQTQAAVFSRYALFSLSS